MRIIPEVNKNAFYTKTIPLHIQPVMIITTRIAANHQPFRFSSKLVYKMAVPMKNVMTAIDLHRGAHAQRTITCICTCIVQTEQIECNELHPTSLNFIGRGTNDTVSSKIDYTL